MEEWRGRGAFRGFFGVRLDMEEYYRGVSTVLAAEGKEERGVLKGGSAEDSGDGRIDKEKRARDIGVSKVLSFP